MIDFYDLLVIRSALEDYYETLWLDFQLAQCKTALDHVKEEIKTYQTGEPITSSGKIRKEVKKILEEGEVE